MSKDGELLFEKSAVKERWVQYIHDLYKDEKRGIRPDYGDDGPSITQDEVSEAIQKIFSVYKLKSFGDKMQPCCTPLLIEKNSEYSSPNLTVAVCCQYSFSITRLSLQSISM